MNADLYKPITKQHSYHDAMLIELKYEGGKDDDPQDPGGRTNQGIIQREFSAWLVKQGKPSRDVFTMTDAERDAIYYQNYGTRIHFDALPPGVDLVLLDGAINSGPSQCVKWCQRALGLTADGVLGDVTMQRIQDHQDHDLLIRQILDRRRAFLRQLSTFSHFGGGWMARVDSLQKTGQAWAMGSVGPVIVFIPNGNKKAKIVDAKPAPAVGLVDATASGGGVSTALTTVQTTIEPLGGHPFADKILMGIMVAGVVLTVVGLAAAWYYRKKRAEREDALDLVTAPAANNDNNYVPDEVLEQYQDPNAKGAATGNIAPGHVTTSGRTTGDTEERSNAPVPPPAQAA